MEAVLQERDDCLTTFHCERSSSGNRCLSVQKTVCYQFDSRALLLVLCLGKTSPWNTFAMKEKSKDKKQRRESMESFFFFLRKANIKKGSFKDEDRFSQFASCTY